MKNRLEVMGLAIIVRSPKPLPTWILHETRPYKELFPGIFAIEHHIRANKQYLVHCSQLSVFTVAGDLASLAELYEESMCEDMSHMGYAENQF